MFNHRLGEALKTGSERKNLWPSTPTPPVRYVPAGECVAAEGPMAEEAADDGKKSVHVVGYGYRRWNISRSKRNPVD